jgi:SAM-dependent methyltransferase
MTGETLAAYYKTNFNTQLNAYDAHAFIQKEGCGWGADWLEQDLSHLEILELGAGTGLFTHHLLSRKAHNLTISDIDALKLKSAERLFTTNDHDIKILNAFQALPKKWDRLYATFLLQWSPNPFETLRFWRSALKPKGRLLVVLPVAPTLASWYLYFSSPLQWHSDTFWLDAFQRTGWNVLRSECQLKHYQFSSPFQLFKTLHITGTQPAIKKNPIPIRTYLKTIPQSVLNTQWKFMRVEATCIK